MRRAALTVVVLLAVAVPAFSQVTAAPTPGPYVVDLRGATVGIPQAVSFYPTIPAGTIVPTRGFGLDVGAHVYAGHAGPARLGFGASFVRIRGTAVTPATTTTSTSGETSSGSDSSSSDSDDEETLANPDIASTVRLFSPQVSFNFGTGAGWSYLSAGLTLVAVKVTAAATTDAPETSRDSGTTTGFNVGAGARWFLNRHFGVGFDLRFHRTGSSTLFGANAGISVK